MRFIKEDYLDAEKQFWDFHTGAVTDNTLFDTSTTGVSDYNYYLKDPNYARDKENKLVSIQYMTPKEYFEECVNIFNARSDKNHSVTAELSQIKGETDTINHLKDVILKWKRKFPMGYLDYCGMEQEGRHRMYVAGELVGWNVKQPVVVAKWHDEEAAMSRKRQKEMEYELGKLRKAIKRATEYTFANISEFREQLQWELNREHSILSYEPDVEFTLESDDNNECFVIKCGIAEDTVDYTDVNFEDRADEDDDVDSYLSNLELDELSDVDADEWLKKYLGESARLDEKIIKNDTLNPAIWEGNDLKPGIADAIKEIVSKYVEDSQVLSYDDIIDIELLGSNASYNYTEHSDLDIHLVVNMESISTDPVLVQLACNAEKALFNNAYNFTIKGLEVELYVEDVKSSAASNGVYSITRDEWIKIPVHKNIPDMSHDSEYLKLLDVWTGKARVAISMNSAKEVQKFVNELYNLRRISIMTDGEYSRGNLVFKEIRNIGLLQELKDKINYLTSKELSLESLQRS